MSRKSDRAAKAQAAVDAMDQSLDVAKEKLTEILAEADKPLTRDEILLEFLDQVTRMADAAERQAAKPSPYVWPWVIPNQPYPTAPYITWTSPYIGVGQGDGVGYDNGFTRTATVTNGAASVTPITSVRMNNFLLGRMDPSDGSVKTTPDDDDGTAGVPARIPA